MTNDSGRTGLRLDGIGLAEVGVETKRFGREISRAASDYDGLTEHERLRVLNHIDRGLNCLVTLWMSLLHNRNIDS